MLGTGKPRAGIGKVRSATFGTQKSLGPRSSSEAPAAAALAALHRCFYGGCIIPPAAGASIHIY